MVWRRTELYAADLMLSMFSLVRSLCAVLSLGIALGSCGAPVRRAVTFPGPTLSVRALVNGVARSFARDMAERRFADQWTMLRPEARAQWPGEAARAAMLRTKFAGVGIEQVRVGSAVSGAVWQNPADPAQRIRGAWRVPISVLLSGGSPPGTARWYRAMDLYILVRGRLPQVAGEGPASPEAPVLEPVRPVERRVRVPILMYHLVGPMPLRSAWTDEYGYAIEAGLTVPPAQFAAQMTYLAGHHYHAISLTRLADALLYGLPLPGRSVVLTFDDGRDSPWTYAVPLLRRLGFTAVFFACSGLVGQTVQTPAHLNVQHYLTWGQIRALGNGGFSIEDHGQKDQTVLWDVGPQEVRVEAGNSAAALEGRSGQDVQFIAYTGALWPYPSASEVGPQQRTMFARLAGLGYVGGVTDSRIATAEESTADLWHLPRIRVNANESLSEFGASLQR